jgi:hypothetical protein
MQETEVAKIQIDEKNYAEAKKLLQDSASRAFKIMELNPNGIVYNHANEIESALDLALMRLGMEIAE